MRIISKYLGDALYSTFISYFIPLFGIASLIFFIKIVSYTSIIKLNLFELIQLYIYVLPQILFFSLPVVFYAATLGMLRKLSFEYESVALFALGISPQRLANILLRFALVLSVLLAITGTILIPQAKQIYKGFIIHKEASAELNLKPSEFGHKFGEWYMYIGSKEGNTYTNVSLFNQNAEGKESFIVAKRATIGNEHAHMAMTLYEGNAYTYEGAKLTRVAFATMKIYDTSAKRYFYYTGAKNYWLYALKNKQRAFDLTLFLLIAFFPLVCVFFLLVLGIYNPRSMLRGALFWAFLLVVLYFSLAFFLAKKFTFWALLFLPFWMAMGFILFYKKTLARY